MIDDIKELNLLLEYQQYLKSDSTAMLEFKAWKAKRPVLTNPKTREELC